MPRRLYDDFLLKRVDLKSCKAGSGQTGERRYAVFGCPHCDAEVEIVENLISNKKAAACGAHLKKCTAYQAKQNQSTQAAPEPPASSTHDQTIDEMRRLLEESEARHQQRHRELMDELQFNRKCLYEVREWAGLTPPDNTLVAQLKLRDQMLLANKEQEIATLQTRYEIASTEITNKAKTVSSHRFWMICQSCTQSEEIIKPL